MLNKFFRSCVSKALVLVAGMGFLFSGSLHAIGENVPFSLIRRILPENPVIVEAGAQFGEDTSWMAEFWPKGTIHSFEPVPETYQLLKQNAQKYSNISTYPIALSNTIGSFPMYLAGGASSLLRPSEGFNFHYFHSDLDHPIYVPCTTLGQWTKDNGIGKIDFLWLDMEGNELRMLKASPEVLKGVKLIYSEVNLQEFWEGCVQYGELKSWLESQGFTEIWNDIQPAWHGNALFVADTH